MAARRSMKAERPLADHEVYLVTNRNYMSDIVAQRLDAAGRFHWDAVPAHIPLAVGVRDDRSKLYPTGAIISATPERYFEPGELRENDKLRAHEHR